MQAQRQTISGTTHRDVKPQTIGTHEFVRNPICGTHRVSLSLRFFRKSINPVAATRDITLDTVRSPPPATALVLGQRAAINSAAKEFSHVHATGWNSGD